MKNYQITQWCSRFIEEQVKEGDICIDATMGNGNDTLLLSRLAGPDGQVLAFDIQEQALQAARQKLLRENAPANYTLFLESHTHMADHVKPDSVSCIVFNFGYLPGGDHSLATRSETSIQALEQSLTLLKKGGLLSLCIYSGGDSGFEERDALLTWLKKLDSHNYLVIRSDYYNRPQQSAHPGSGHPGFTESANSFFAAQKKSVLKTFSLIFSTDFLFIPKCSCIVCPCQSMILMDSITGC